ncbi:Uncharacterised protein [Mycobacteroides abscessus subsp. abscessus]|nr:Uncharacterised protein [Mycobacteroides abscessus subsp. abscessus]
MALSTRTLTSLSVAALVPVSDERDTGLPMVPEPGSVCAAGGLHAVASLTGASRVSAEAQTKTVTASNAMPRISAGK